MEPRARATAESLSFLESRTVTPRQARDYRVRAEKFSHWTKCMGLDISTPALLEAALLEWCHESFFEGGLPGLASKLLAALVFTRLDLAPGAPELARARRAVKGWQKLVPPTSRLPFPWLGVAAVAFDLVQRRLVLETAATVLSFVFYLRPSEVLRLRGKNFVPPPSLPRRRRGEQSGLWSLILHFQEDAEVSKVGCTDESLLADNPLFPWLPELMQLLRHRGLEQRTFAFGHAHWARVRGQRAERAAGRVRGCNVVSPATRRGLSRHASSGEEPAVGENARQVEHRPEPEALRA